MNRRLANWLINKVLPHLLIVPEPSQLITYDKNTKKVFIGGQEANETELRNLKEEARYLDKTRLWQLFVNQIAEQSRQKMFEKSNNYDDMFAGKMMLYNLSVLQQIIDIAKSQDV